MDRTTVVAAVLGVGLVLGIAIAAYVVSRPPTGLTGARLKVEVHRSSQQVPGDSEGALVGLRPTDPFGLEVRLCPGQIALPSNPELAVWTAPGKGAWITVPADDWRSSEDCLETSVSVPVSVAWPNVARGVGRWAVVVGEGASVLPDRDKPVPLWRKTALVFDGEVVIVPVGS
jgi:hypothetical protein